jgi:hypothetical protein
MAESTENLVLEFLTWVADRPRTYEETMDAWQSHCPRQTIWEDAIIDGLVKIESTLAPQGSKILLTERGEALLRSRMNGCLS